MVDSHCCAASAGRRRKDPSSEQDHAREQNTDIFFPKGFRLLGGARRCCGGNLRNLSGGSRGRIVFCRDFRSAPGGGFKGGVLESGFGCCRGRCCVPCVLPSSPATAIRSGCLSGGFRRDRPLCARSRPCCVGSARAGAASAARDQCVRDPGGRARAGVLRRLDRPAAVVVPPGSRGRCLFVVSFPDRDDLLHAAVPRSLLGVFLHPPTTPSVVKPQSPASADFGLSGSPPPLFSPEETSSAARPRQRLLLHRRENPPAPPLDNRTFFSMFPAILTKTCPNFGENNCHRMPPARELRPDKNRHPVLEKTDLDEELGRVRSTVASLRSRGAAPPTTGTASGKLLFRLSEEPDEGVCPTAPSASVRLVPGPQPS